MRVDTWQSVSAGRALGSRQLAMGRIAASHAADAAAAVLTANTLAGSRLHLRHVCIAAARA
jgi:hypothetical protein